MPKQKVTPRSGNVFADLGLPDAEKYLDKAKLALRIVEIIQERKLSQTKAAQLLGLDQSNLLALMRGKLDGFSISALRSFASSLRRFA